jgi:CHAD domain-containing protein
VHSYRSIEAFYDDAHYTLARAGLLLSHTGFSGPSSQQRLTVCGPDRMAGPGGALTVHECALLAACSDQGVADQARKLLLATTGIAPLGLSRIFERHRQVTEVDLVMGGTRLRLSMSSGRLLAGTRRLDLKEATLAWIKGDRRHLFDLAREIVLSQPARVTRQGSTSVGLALAGFPPDEFGSQAVPGTEFTHAGRAEQALGLLGERSMAELIPVLGATLVGRDPEDIHQTRVRLRRVRLILQWLARIDRIAQKSSPSESAALDAALRVQYRALGPARDWTIFAENLVERNTEEPGGRLQLGAQQREQEEGHRARARLAAPALQSLVIQSALQFDLARQGTAAFSTADLEALILLQLHRSDRRLRRELKGLAHRNAEAQHRARRLARRMRDEAQLVALLGGHGVPEGYASQLARLQTRLGELHDWASGQVLVSQLGPLAEANLARWLKDGYAKSLRQARRVARKFGRVRPT